MTRPHTLAAPALAVLLLAGCGSSGDALSGKAPRTILTDAVQKETTSSLRFSLGGRFNVDISQVRNLSAADITSFGLPVGGATVAGKGEQESSKRQETDIELSGGSTGRVREVNYDGTSYVSRDGGKTYANASAGAVTGALTLSPSQLTDVARNATNVRDLGRRTVDGQDCEHLQAPVTAAQLARVLGPGGQSGNDSGGQGADLLKQLVQVRHGVLDVDVRRSDGALIRSVAEVAVALDLDRLAGLFGAAGTGTPSGIPGGVVAIEISLDGHFSDYGASVSVPKPTVTAGSAAGPTADGSAPSLGAGLSTPGGGDAGAPSPGGTP